MRTAFYYLIRIALAVGVIIGVFKLYKYRDTVTIDPTNYAMDQVTYPPGTYRVDSYLTDPKKLVSGDVVAYYLPGQHVEVRVSRVAATEGQRIEFTGEAVVVDGKPTKFPAMTLKFPEITIPRDCVFLISDQPQNTTDSLKIGPVPSYMLYGKLK